VYDQEASTMNTKAVQQMRAAGGTPEKPQANGSAADIEHAAEAAEPAQGELVERVPARGLNPAQWQDVATIAEMMTRHNAGRLACDAYEVFRSDDGAVHIVIAPPR
jgi:hypothetical protein